MTAAKTPKVILITGCSSGFGLLMAARFSSCGHFVFATMRHLEKKQALLDEVSKRGGNLQVLQLDVNNAESVRSAVRQVIDQTGRIDVLINNAGFALGGFFEDLAEEEIRAQMETNFFGAQAVTREVLPFMRSQKKGWIINISSVSGLYTAPALGAYSASKWALEGFSEGLYYEVKPFGIHVCLVEPGTYPTEIFGRNKKYGKNFNNPLSPYLSRSKFLDQRVADYVSHVKKDPKTVVRLVESLMNSVHPPLRSVPDTESRIIVGLRKILPLSVFTLLFERILFWGYRKESKT